MADLVLGMQPQPLTVNLVSGASFATTLRAQSGEWPTGVSIELRFDDTSSTTWSATISGADATFDVAPADVTALTSRRPNTAQLWLITADGSEYPWASGFARING